MKPWLPSYEPHTNHPAFPFDPVYNNPVKDGKIDLGRGRPTDVELDSSDPSVKLWARACNKLLELVDRYNEALELYKNADPRGEDPGGDTTAAKKYRKAVKDLNEFIRKGLHDYLEPGSLALEAVESGGLVGAIRIYGRVLEQRPPVFHSHSSSSVFFSMYPRQNAVPPLKPFGVDPSPAQQPPGDHSLNPPPP